MKNNRNIFVRYVREIILLVFLLNCITAGHAQVNDTTLNALSNVLIDRIERLSEDSDEVIDFGELLDEYLFFVENPINLNSPNAVELRDSKLITHFQYEKLTEYVNNFGPIMSVFELASIEGFDKETIEIISPIVTTSEIIRGNDIHLNKTLKWGKNKLFLRMEQVLEKAQGYQSIEDSALYQNPNSIYLGSRQKVYAKYAFNYRKKIRFGFTSEKDAGEVFLKNNVNDSLKQLLGNQLKNGFDFYSAHLFLSDFGFLKSLAIGDYHLAFGQGLTMWSGLSFGKSGSATNIMKYGQGLKPSASANENMFLRGCAFTLKHSDFELTAFYSNKKFDGNIASTDSVSGEINYISSLQESGLHRTVNELLDKGAIKQEVFGGNITYKNRIFQIGYTAHQTNFDTEINPTVYPYNQFSLMDKNTFNHGADFKVFFQKIALFGEFTQSQSGGHATIAGLNAQPASFASMTIAYRKYSKDYQNFYSNGFGESSETNNETGIYIGLDTDIAAKWKLSAYTDFFKFPWLRYQTDAPSFGHDYFVQLNHKINRKADTYLRFRTKTKMTNNNNPWNSIDYISEYTKTSTRFHINYLVSPTFEFRDRIELILYDEGLNIDNQGFMIYHDVVYKPITKPFEITFRYAIFDSDSYDSRIYAYENDVLYAFSIPAFSDKGSRIYLLFRLKATESINLWLRFAQTWYANRETIGSGSETINGNKKTDIKIQMQWNF